MTTAQPHDSEPKVAGDRPVDTEAEVNGEHEVDWTWTNDDSAWIPPDIDTAKPSPARMYDYSLGGKDNFAVDREAVEAVGEIVPEFRAVGMANRRFLVQAVETLSKLGIDQFVDLGTGIPTSPNVHEVAQQTHPQAKVVYVDNDPIVMAHNRALRARRPGVLTLDRDMRQPASVMDDPQVRAHLDFDRPIGLLFIAVLHFVRRELGVELVKQFCRSVPPGSYLAISTACADGMESAVIERLEAVYAKSAAPFVLRSTAQVEQLFDGVDLLEPGVVDVTRWRANGTPLPMRILCGIGKVR